MKSGTCPKCQSTDVRMTQDGFSWPKAKAGVHLKTEMVVQASPMNTYVCTACGYFEHYVADPGKLAEVAQLWRPASP